MDTLPFFSGFDISLLIKIPVLILLFLYILFAGILYNKTRTLGKIVFIEASATTFLLNTLSLLHLLAAVLLFFFALVIL